MLKAPFNIHHDSLKLSVPMIDVKNFDVDNCITLADMLGDYTNINQIKGTSKYSLGDYIRYFEKFCDQLEKDDQNVASDLSSF